MAESEYWPALSESIRSSPKYVIMDSPKVLSPAPPNASSQGTNLGLEKETATIVSNPIPSANPSYVGSPRQNSINRVAGNPSHIIKSGNNKPANGSLSQAQSAPASPSVISKSGSSVGESSTDSSSIQKNEQHPFRRSHSGPLFRGGNGRDQDRRRKDWGSRSFGRENHHAPQQALGYRPFVPFPSHPVAMQPFSSPMVYPGVHAPFFYVPGPHPDFHRPLVPMVAVSPPFPVPDSNISSHILKQIDYYFSDENLVKDWYLRKNMDGEGWVPIELVANFRKVAQLTDNIQLIVEALRGSNVVEIQGDKLRRKTDWLRWIPRFVTSEPPQSDH